MGGTARLGRRAQPPRPASGPRTRQQHARVVLGMWWAGRARRAGECRQQAGGQGGRARERHRAARQQQGPHARARCCLAPPRPALAQLPAPHSLPEHCGWLSHGLPSTSPSLPHWWSITQAVHDWPGSLICGRGRGRGAAAAEARRAEQLGAAWQAGAGLWVGCQPGAGHTAPFARSQLSLPPRQGLPSPAAPATSSTPPPCLRVAVAVAAERGRAQAGGVKHGALVQHTRHVPAGKVRGAVSKVGCRGLRKHGRCRAARSRAQAAVHAARRALAAMARHGLEAWTFDALVAAASRARRGQRPRAGQGAGALTC